MNDRLCTLLYALYALGMLAQFTFQTAIIGSIAVIAAIVIAYAKRKDSKGSTHESHIQWLIRTFWIGGGVYLPILTVIGTGFIAAKLDLSFLAEIDETLTDTEVAEAIMSKNSAMISNVIFSILALFAAWWLWRCWKGYRHLKSGTTVPNENSWL